MLLKFLFLVYLVIKVETLHSNNVCNNYLHYYIKAISKHCWYNPDVGKDMPWLARSHNYPFVTHYVITKDKYNLTLYQLPKNSNRKGVVFLQHAFLATSNIFLDKGNASLAYSLYNDGYEVWLPNSRGNYYSRRHLTLKPSQKEFWNFTYHEMSIYDIPIQLEKISNISKSKVHYIGHSMGGPMGLIYASMLPEHAKKYLHQMILLAPAVYLKNIASPLKYIAPYADFIHYIAEFLNMWEFTGKHGIFVHFVKLCHIFPFFTKLCAILVTWYMDITSKTFNTLPPEYLPIASHSYPAGSSFKAVIHYAQNMASGGKFAQYNYGKINNLKFYNSSTPPDYPLHKIKTPVRLILAERDNFVSKDGLELLKRNLPPNILKQPVETIKGYNHANFMYAHNLEQELNQRVKRMLNVN